MDSQTKGSAVTLELLKLQESPGVQDTLTLEDTESGMLFLEISILQDEDIRRSASFTLDKLNAIQLASKLINWASEQM